MKTSASTVGLPEDKAYIAHHFNCPTCCAAGLSGGKQARCQEGLRLWNLYQRAFKAQQRDAHQTRHRNQQGFHA